MTDSGAATTAILGFAGDGEPAGAAAGESGSGLPRGRPAAHRRRQAGFDAGDLPHPLISPQLIPASGSEPSTSARAEHVDQNTRQSQ